MSESSRCPKCSDEWKQKRDNEYNKTQRNKEHEKFYQSKEWREIRQEAIIRDGFKCGLCGKPVGVKPRDHVVDHIQEITDGGSKLDLNNLMTVCQSCHNKKGKSK